MEYGKASTGKECKNIVRSFRDVMRKAKAHLELHLVRKVKDRKKGLFRYVNRKRNTRENVGLLMMRWIPL